MFDGQDIRNIENNVNLAESWNVIIVLQKRIVFVSGSSVCPEDSATDPIIMVFP